MITTQTIRPTNLGSAWAALLNDQIIYRKCKIMITPNVYEIFGKEYGSLKEAMDAIDDRYNSYNAIKNLNL